MINDGVQTIQDLEIRVDPYVNIWFDWFCDSDDSPCISNNEPAGDRSIGICMNYAGVIQW